jgi:hypothetical protein
VADTNTLMPGTQESFTSLRDPVISGRNIAFRVEDTSGGRKGIYLFDGTTLKCVADNTTRVPGTRKTFSDFYQLGISGPNLVFWGEEISGATRGFYLFNGRKIRVVVDTHTLIPGTQQSFFNFYNAAISGKKVTFQGELGIYLFEAGRLKVVADSDTELPGLPGKAVGLFAPVISWGKVVFLAGRSSAGQSSGGQGIYVYDGSGIRFVADTNTMIPGTQEHFYSFDYPTGWTVISGKHVAFWGTNKSWTLRGIYLFKL